MRPTYSIVGLGKLGASMLAAIASRGFDVIGVDVNQRAVDLLKDGHAPVQETDLQELVAINRGRIKATLSHREAILNSDLTFVIVPTPSDERGAFSLQYAAWAFREIGRALNAKRGYHTVVLTSTVLPGSTRFGLLPILERQSKKRCGPDFGLCYSPEFIALGSVIHDFLHPDFTLVGEFDRRGGDQLEAAYAAITENAAPCQRMSLENAELAQIGLNAFVTTKITFANMLADLCERIPGGDVDVVTNAIGFDRRIGHKYLKGAGGYGGPCFPRDNVALGFVARTLGSRATLCEVTHETNRLIPGRVVERLKPFLHKGATVAVLGLAYKPFSHVVEESQGVHLARALSRAGARVVAYDPLADEAARLELRDQAVLLNSVADCLVQADIVVVTTPDPAFLGIGPEDFAGRSVMVMDLWRVLDARLPGHANIRYIPLGRSIDDHYNAAALAALWNGAPEGSVGD